MTLPLLLALACAPKTGVVTAPPGTDIAMVGALEPLDDPTVQRLPDDVIDGLLADLSARGLAAAPVDESTWTGAFTKGRTTRFRVAHVAMGTDAGLVLVVETFARYGSQLNGRYRWTVQVVATVAPQARPEDAVTSEFSVPVFLQFHHEKDAEAVSAAAPVIERQVGHLLDQVLGGMAVE